MKKEVKLENIDFSYPGKDVFRNLQVNFPAGRIHAVMGNSGSGKTTLLRLIAGFEVPRKGRILFDDKPVSATGKIIAPPYERDLGYVFQDGALWPHMTVKENIFFGLSTPTHPPLWNELLRKFPLQDLLHRYPAELSGGQQQLVAIARAVLPRPSLLLMDEPLSNIDVMLKKELLAYIRKLNKKYGMTVIYVTHNHREAFRIADRLLLLHRGDILADGTPEQIRENNHPFVQLFMEF